MDSLGVKPRMTDEEEEHEHEIKKHMEKMI